MSAPTNLWNAAYEASPSGTDLISNGDDRIRALKSDIRERHEREHVRNASDKTLDGLHREGSARAYYVGTEPTNRPDGTSLDSNDDGRLWYDSTNDILYVYTGSAWEVVPTSVVSSPIGAKSADYTITDTDNLSTILMTTGATNRTVTLPTAADNANRLITVKKVDDGSGYLTLDGEGAETVEGQANLRFEIQYSGCTVVCDGTEWHVVETIGCELLDVSGSLEAVYTKYLTGTLDADAATTIEHGISGAVIISAMCSAKVGPIYYVYDFDNPGASTGSGFIFHFSSSSESFVIGNTNEFLYSEPYRIVFKYYI